MTLPSLLEITGVIAFALSGMIAARRKDMDPVGIFTVGFVTAFGGGTLRDVILGNLPVSWMADPTVAIAIFFAAIGYAYLPWSRHVRDVHIVVPDALGLGIFAVMGTRIGLEAGVPYFSASLLGVITGTFGGVMRDVLCTDIPMIFRKSSLYASCAFAGCWTLILLRHFGIGEAWQVGLGVVVVFGLRMGAFRFNWRLQGRAGRG